MPSNIRTDSDTRHVNDAGSEKEIANARVTSNESEAIWQCSLWAMSSASSLLRDHLIHHAHDLDEVARILQPVLSSGASITAMERKNRESNTAKALTHITNVRASDTEQKHA